MEQTRQFSNRTSAEAHSRIPAPYALQETGAEAHNGMVVVHGFSHGFMNRRSRFVEDWSSLVRIMTGLIFLSVLLCCQGLFDESQVQVVTEPSAFKEFPLPPREVVYGPYSMLTADATTMIAWEEKEWTGKLRHVEVPFDGLD